MLHNIQNLLTCKNFTTSSPSTFIKAIRDSFKSVLCDAQFNKPNKSTFCVNFVEQTLVAIKKLSLLLKVSAPNVGFFSIFSST